MEYAVHCSWIPGVVMGGEFMVTVWLPWSGTKTNSNLPFLPVGVTEAACLQPSVPEMDPQIFPTSWAPLRLMILPPDSPRG